jgi:membrane protein YdbS with pleckstrin-like domain
MLAPTRLAPNLNWGERGEELDKVGDEAGRHEGSCRVTYPMSDVSCLEGCPKAWERKGVDTQGTAEQTQGPGEQERVIWTAHPSQIINFGAYAACLLLLLLLIPAFYFARQAAHSQYILISLGVIMAIALAFFLIKWIITRARVYQVTTERIKITDGVFNRKTEEVELYRVRDYKLTEPFWLRMFGLGNIVISTTDNSSPTVVLQAVRNANGRREELRKYVELCRDKKRVRITEMES